MANRKVFSFVLLLAAASIFRTFRSLSVVSLQTSSPRDIQSIDPSNHFDAKERHEGGHEGQQEVIPSLTSSLPSSSPPPDLEQLANITANSDPINVPKAKNESVNIYTNPKFDAKSKAKRLPTLDELTSLSNQMNYSYSCPEGTEIFENIVLPENMTHTGRKIPRVLHITAKTRCVTPSIREHLSKWKFPNHSLYFHDDDAVYQLMEYSINDRHGHELIRGLSNLYRNCIMT